MKGKSSFLKALLIAFCSGSILGACPPVRAGSGTVRATSTTTCDRRCQEMRREEVRRGNLCADEMYSLLNFDYCVKKAMNQMMDGLIKIKESEFKMQKGGSKAVSPSQTSTSNYISIATSDMQGKAFFSSKSQSEDRAQSDAIAKCFFSDCRVLGTTRAKGWMAVVEGRTAWYSVYGFPSMEAAKARAIEKCQLREKNYSSECKPPTTAKND